MRITFLIVFLAFSNLAWGMGRLPTGSQEDALVSQAAPDLSLGKTDGTTGSVMASREGKKAMLVFWASWCPHCREELAQIKEDLPTIEQKGYKVILVNVGESKEEAIAYLKGQNITMVSFLDEENAFSELYHVEGIPTLAFINEQGIVRSIDHGYSVDSL